MKRFLSFIFLIGAFITSVSAQNSSYSLNVENFSELEVIDGVHVEYYCNADSAGWVTFDCDPSMVSKITFVNKRNRLTIQTTAEEAPYKGLPVVKVYSVSLQKVINSGDSIISVTSDVPVQKFSAKQIGNGSIYVNNVEAEKIDISITAGKGNIYVSGKAESGKFTNVGTGQIYADKLRVEKASCFVLGPGSIYCSPVESLKIFGAGKGRVIYTTPPEKVKNRSIGVKSVASVKENDTKENELLS